MKNTETEGIYYCTRCGASNKKSAVECSECEKKIISKYRPFYDFLKKHSKEETTDATVDTAFALIRRFLLSHVYGFVLTVSIIAAGVVTVLGMDLHIDRVSTDANIKIQVQAPKKETNNELNKEQIEELPVFEFSDSDSKSIRNVTHWYGNFNVRYRGKEDIIPYVKQAPFASNDEMLAEKNIPDYKYEFTHELITNPIDLTADMEPTMDQETHDWYAQEILSGNLVVTDTAKTLRQAGYEVAEVKYIVNYAIGEYEFDTHDGDLVAQAVCHMVMVCHEDNWYIAEDKIIEKKKFI